MPSAPRQRLGKGLGIEGLQVVLAFAHPDIMDRQAEIVAASATRMPPLAVPSSLVMTSPVSGTLAQKASTWDIAFWPVVASSTSSTAWGAVGSSFLITRAIFSSSAISPALFCKRPAVSISRMSLPLAAGLFQRLEGQPRGVAAGLGGDELRPGASGPDPQLLDGGGAERVAGRQHHFRALLAPSRLASLPMVVVLPVPLTPGHQDDERLFAVVDGQRLFDRRQQGGDFAAPGLRRQFRARDFGVIAVLGQRHAASVVRWRRAHVGADQRFFQLRRWSRHRASSW